MGCERIPRWIYHTIKKQNDDFVSMIIRKLLSRIRTGIQNPWFWLIFSAYFLRIVLMPVTGQNDSLFMPWQAHFILSGHFDVYAFLHQQFGEKVISPTTWAPYPYGYYGVTAGWLWVLQKLHLINLTGWDSSWSIMHPARVLFLMKLPYLVCDIAVGALLFRLLGGSRRGVLAWAAWAWSATVFYLLMMGQNDLYPVALTTLGLFCATRSIQHKYNPAHRSNVFAVCSVLLLGVGSVFKIYPLLLLAPVVLLLTERWPARLGLFLMGIAPFALAAIPFLSTEAYLRGVLFNQEGSRIFGGNQQFFALPGSLFLVGYFALLAFLLIKKTVDAWDCWSVSLGVLATLFLFVSTPFYWAVWLTPMLIAETCSREKRLFWVWLTLECVFSLFLLNRHRELGVALPVHLSEEFNLPNLTASLAIPGGTLVLRAAGVLEVVFYSLTTAALCAGLFFAIRSVHKNPSPVSEESGKVFFVLIPLFLLLGGLFVNLAAGRDFSSPILWQPWEKEVTLAEGTPRLSQSVQTSLSQINGFRVRLLRFSGSSPQLTLCLTQANPAVEALACSTQSTTDLVEDQRLYFMFARPVQVNPESQYRVNLVLDGAGAGVALPFSARAASSAVELGGQNLVGTIDLAPMKSFDSRAAVHTLLVTNILQDPILLVLMAIVLSAAGLWMAGIFHFPR